MRGVTHDLEGDRATRARPWGGRWPLERALFALAGTVTLAAAALGAFVSPWFLLLAVLVGVSQWMYAAVGECPASMVLVRATGLRPGCAR
jgi:hypothetical protein